MPGGFDEGIFDQDLFDKIEEALEEAHFIYPPSIVDPLPLVIYPVGAVSAFVTGTHVLGVNVIASSIATRETFGRTRISLTMGLTGIPSAEAFGTHTLSAGTHTIQVPTIYLDA